MIGKMKIAASTLTFSPIASKRLIVCDAGRILIQLRGAAGPDTKLLIGEMLLPNAYADEAAYEGADGSAERFPFVTKDSPLLPNLGIANIHGYLVDIMVRVRLRATGNIFPYSVGCNQMMGTFDAKERTEDEMAALVLSAGWQIAEIRRTPGSVWAYTTAVPI